MPAIPLTLRTPEDDSDRKLLADIETHGWHMVVIAGEEGCPEYVFTVGLFYTYGHPEIVLMGLPREAMYQLLQGMVQEIGQGKKFADGEVNAGLASFPIAFRSVEISRYPEYLGYGIWFYHSLPAPFPALQFVWPDREGKFPWDAGYDVRFLTLQHPLYEAEA